VTAVALPRRARVRPHLASAGAAVTTARLASLVLAAVQVPLVARLVPHDEFATVPLTVQAAVLLGLVLADPAVLAFQRHPGALGDRADYRWAARRAAVGLGTGCALLLAVGALVGAPALALGIAGWTLGLTVNRLSAIAWLMWGREWRYAISLVGSTALRTAVLVVALSAGTGPGTALALAGALSALLAVVLAPRTQPTTGRPPRADLRLGTGLAVGQLGLHLLGSAPLVVGSSLLGTGATARLGAATQVALLLGTALNLVTTLAYPRLRRRWDDGDEAGVLATGRLLVVAFAAGGAAALSVSGAADSALLRVALTDGLVDGALVAALVTASCASSMALVASWTHQFRLRARRIAVRSLTTAALALGLVAVGTLLDGVRGAAVGGLVGMLCHAAAMAAGSGLVTARTLAAGASLVAAAGLCVVVPGGPASTAVAAGVALIAGAAAALHGRGCRDRRAAAGARPGRPS